jgi:hypothetical protein
MTLVPEYNTPDRLLTPKETVHYLYLRYGILISLPTFYSMISRKESPLPTYFRGRPRFTLPNIDARVERNLSDDRKNGGI